MDRGPTGGTCLNTGCIPSKMLIYAADRIVEAQEAKRLGLVVEIKNIDFNFIIDTAPIGDENKDYYLWHIRIVPRLTAVAGFEIGTGIYINTALPEETAKFMRELKAE